jgi:hypothetical protein
MDPSSRARTSAPASSTLPLTFVAAPWKKVPKRTPEAPPLAVISARPESRKSSAMLPTSFPATAAKPRAIPTPWSPSPIA